MDLERSLDLLARYVMEVAQQKTVDTLASLAAALQQAASSPNPQTDEAFKNQLKSFFATLDASPSNAWSPADRRHLESLGLASATGQGLRKRLEEILLSDSLTKTLAAQRVSQLVESVRAAVNQATQISTAFGSLGVRARAPSGDECEVVLVIPPPRNNDTLEFLDSDLDEFNTLLKYLNELTGNMGASPRVTGLATGSWEIYVQLSVAAAAKLIELIRGIIGLRREVGELRKKTDAFKDVPLVPHALLEPILEIANKRIESGLEEVSEVVVESSQTLADGRKNELKIAVKRSVRFLAKRLDEGVRVEIEPPKQLSQAAQQDKNAEEVEELQKQLGFVTENAPLIAKMEEAEKPVLLLPEPAD
jgi:hypothetical protein